MCIQMVSELQQHSQGTGENQAASSLLCWSQTSGETSPGWNTGRVCRVVSSLQLMKHQILKNSFPQKHFLSPCYMPCSLVCKMDFVNFSVSECPNFSSGDFSLGQETSQELGHDNSLCNNTFEAQRPDNCPMWRLIQKKMLVAFTEQESSQPARVSCLP